MVRIITIVVTILLSGCAYTPLQQSVTPKPRSTIRLATYNIYWQNGNKNKCNPNSIPNVILSMKPDILVLQETFSFTEKRIDRTFKTVYPYHRFRNFNHRGNEDGLGIMSRYPIVKSFYFPPIYGWFPGWLFVIKTPQGYVQILNVHLNPKLISNNNVGFLFEALWTTPTKRLNEISYYYKFLNPKLPTIIAGDFNESDDGAATTFLRNHCFRDLVLGIPNHIKTWHWQYGPIILRGRYDRIYTSPDIVPLNCQVLQRGLSDHYPVLIDYETKN